MEIIAINGSARKNGNTATMLRNYLEGVSSVSEKINTRIINLYDLQYTGCIGCLGCKAKNSNNYGRCIVKDGIYDLLREVTLADAVAIGSPIYFGEITGQLRSFLERLTFPLYTYRIDQKILTPKRFPVTMIYTMNVTKELIGQLDYLENWKRLEDLIGRIFSPPRTLYAYNTYQVNNYNNFELEIFSESAKAEYRRTQFPLDCCAAYENGKETAESLFRSQI